MRFKFWAKSGTVRTKFSIVLSLILAISFVCGCGQNSSDKVTEKEKVSVGTWKTAQTIQPFFYQEYSNDSLEVEVLPFTNPADQKTALLAGSLQMCGTTLVSAISAAANGEPIKIVAGMCNKCSALVVGKDSGIKTEADLKGKTIAYVPGTMHHILLLDVLRRNHIDPEKEVTLKRIDFFDMGTALSNGNIDAFCSGEPYPTIAELDGYGKILSYPYFDDSISTINAAMITTEDLIKDDPELIQKLVDAHIGATKALNADTDQWLDKAVEFGTDRKVLDASLENMELFYDIDDTYIEYAKNLAKEMKGLDLIDEIPDIEAMFDLSFLENAKQN